MDGIKRATDVMIAGKVALVCGYGDVGKGSRPGAARAVGAGVGHRDRSDLRAAGGDGRLPGRHHGLRAPTRPTSSSSATGNFHVITHDHMARMKNQAIVCNIGHFDNEIDVAALKQYRWENIKPQVDHVIFPDGKRIILLAEGRLVNLGCATGHPSYVMSLLVRQPGDGADRAVRPTTRKYPVGVYVLPKHLDEKVARLQLEEAQRTAHGADRTAGALYRRGSRRALQERSLPLLRARGPDTPGGWCTRQPPGAPAVSARGDAWCLTCHCERRGI